MKRVLVLGFLFIAFAFGFQVESQTTTLSSSIAAEPVKTMSRSKPAANDELRAAATKAIKVIQKSQSVWYQKQVCTSCHHQLLPEISINLARERGVPIDEKVARSTTDSAFAMLKDLDATVQGHDYIDIVFDGWVLTSGHIAGVRPSLSTDFEAQFIASQQLPDGSWPTIDVRPPQSQSIFTSTAVCAEAVRRYLPQPLKAEKETRLRLARNWLLRSQPRTTEDRTYRLFGLRWTGASESARRSAARQLLADQKKDGGWAQMAGMASDSYATGEALVALHEGAGIPTSDPAYQRGLRFLLRTQESDGSWRIKSRLHPPAPVSPPFVNVEFPPFQHDQFISIMGTTWAAAALMSALPAEKGTQLPGLDPAPAAQAEWIRVALTGSAAELKKLLDAGMKPDAKTAGGTTALMMAARDLAKVKLLVDRGADVNARAATGITPLMVASRYRGNVEVVRLLLKKGAKPNSEKGVEVRNDATALMFAVMAGDAPMAGALLDAGARVGDRMKVLGTFFNSPLNYATAFGDAAMVNLLIARGANPNEVDDDRISMLGWATIANRAKVAQALLARGAQVNHVDKYGMTPLLYAASIDFGDTAVLEKLIAAGADLKAKNKDGLTALDLAKSYHHETMASLLTGRMAAR
ncbi:MAG TPA: ankyrin repeat domain-containing protein [Blastocatellia bacterium]|nr:ankyrin repeat domain-containing protein [Blastocatellia bacterium]